MVIGLQYSRAKFALPYARGHVLFSLFQGTEGISFFMILPVITRTIVKPWLVGRGSGPPICHCIHCSDGISPDGNRFGTGLGHEIIGLLLLALDSCTTGLLLGWAQLCRLSR